MAQSSPSPSAWASSLHSKAPGAAFRIPGPSTRFHKEHKQQEQLRLLENKHAECPRPKYARFSSVGAYDSATTRARSRLSASPSGASPSAIPSPQPARTDSNHRKSWSHSSSSMAQNAPLTPVRSPRHSIMGEYDSPYSDYFTDENRSVDDRAQYATPSTESQKLLLRLNTLGAEILRQDLSGPTTSDIEAKLDDLEAALGTPGSNSVRSLRFGDSSLYNSGADDGQESQTTPSARPSVEVSDRPSTPLTVDTSADHIPTAVKARLRNQERLLKEAQDVLQRVSRANDSLRKRYEEIRQIHDNTVLELEEAAQEALLLKSENESLKADLGFDHSELLFMKLQLKALEVEADAISEQLVAGSELSKKRVLVNDDIERWKSDWDDVDARLRSRRERHRVVSTTPEKLAGARDGPKTEALGDWRLDMCKKRHGRVQSITIKRMSSLALSDGEDDDEEEEDKDHVEELPLTGPVFTPLAPSPVYCEQATQTEESSMTTSELEQMIAEAELRAQDAGIFREEDDDASLDVDQEGAESDEDEVDEDEEEDENEDEDEDQDEDEVEHDHDVSDFGELNREDENEHDDGGFGAKTPVQRDFSIGQSHSPKKSAWQELYDSLSSFAGMDRD